MNGLGQSYRYLNDVGRVVSDDKDHANWSAKIAEKFMDENGLVDFGTRKVVIDCCLNHGRDANPTTPEGKLMRLMDKAALIDPKIVEAYKTILENKFSYEAVMEKVKVSLDKWYEFCKDSGFVDEMKYRDCLKILS
ncbi:MAG: hypothetical protein KKG59_06200 [Nanoarchaeota archaeon]|nr:hypothetical protein [Nanoarchaeota archaeon]